MKGIGTLQEDNGVTSDDEVDPDFNDPVDDSAIPLEVVIQHALGIPTSKSTQVVESDGVLVAGAAVESAEVDADVEVAQPVEQGDELEGNARSSGRLKRKRKPMEEHWKYKDFERQLEEDLD